MKNKKLKAQLTKYRNKVNKWRANIIKKDKYDKEQNTVIKFVVPLFEILGWSPLYTDMEFEHTVYNKDGKKLGRADIALYTEDSSKQKAKPKILIEIKGVRHDVKTGRQLFRYLKAENINYGIYTNGKTLILFDKRYTRPGYIPHTLFRLESKDFARHSDILQILSKTMVKKDKLDRLARCYHAKEYWAWRKIYRKNHPKTSDYQLPLIYAREKIKEL